MVSPHLFIFRISGTIYFWKTCCKYRRKLCRMDVQNVYILSLGFYKLHSSQQWLWKYDIQDVLNYCLITHFAITCDI